LKGPLIAVISVGIAAAAPAVAVSETITDAKAPSPRVVTSDAGEPVGPATGEHSSTHDQIRHKRLVRRFLALRNLTNRLIARRDHHKPRIVHTADELRWSNRALARQIRLLKKRSRRIREQLRDRRAGLTPAISAALERIAACESHGNPRAIGGGGAFRGKYQFTYGTWASVGGKGDPAVAREAEQDRRAAILLRRSGTSAWPVCG
jgi:hypothetical protein